MKSFEERVLDEVEKARDELVDFASELVRIPSINPPGDAYEDVARLIGDRLEAMDFEVEYVVASDRPEHSERYPRTNVIGRRRGASDRPLLHLNGHTDAVPAGHGWTVDPFAGVVKDGKLYGRGSCDMKAGIAAAVYACEAVRRAGLPLAGSLEVSGTVDEESGGFAGMAHLCERGYLASDRTDYVIIPEPLNVDRICVGHRGVYWFKVTAHGRVAHGSMPFLGVSAIDRMTSLLSRIQTELVPRLRDRVTATPVVPEGARHATLNVNALHGGQGAGDSQSPCVADRCEAIFDRRFLREEDFEQVRREIREMANEVDAGRGSFELEDLMVVHPVQTPASSPVVDALDRAVSKVLGKTAEHIASPGTYDHKHVARIAGVAHCVAYGPGVLELAHQVDEYCAIDDLVDATRVLGLSIAALVGPSD